MLLWYNSRLVTPQSASTSRTFRPRFGEVEVVPITRKPLPERKKQRPRLILSPQGRVAIRKRDEELKTVDHRNETQTLTPIETNDPTITQTKETENHAETVKNFPRGETRPRNLRCVGWKATDDCSPNGPRVPEKDHSCMTRVPAGVSGYCEVEDTDSGERFRVGRRFCNSLKQDGVFRCSDAVGFANFPALATDALQKALEPGIVMVIYPKLMASAYATIRVLRDFGCKLPLEPWYKPSRDEESSCRHEDAPGT